MNVDFGIVGCDRNGSFSCAQFFSGIGTGRSRSGYDNRKRKAVKLAGEYVWSRK